MRRQHLYVLLLVAIVLTVSELYPHWLYEDERWHVYYSAGYSWYLDPPKQPTQEEAARIIGRPHERSTHYVNNELKVSNAPEPFIPIRVFQNKTRVRGQEILAIFAALGAFLFLFDRRLFMALLLPGALAAAVISALGYIEHKLNFNIGAIAFFPIFIGTACVSIYLLRGARFNRFWKAYLFSTASALLPWLMVFAAALTFSVNGGGYLWLGVTVMSILTIAAALVSFPITLSLYKSSIVQQPRPD